MTDAADITILLDELAGYLADACDLVYDPVGEGERRELFIHTLDRESAAATASVISSSGGPGVGWDVGVEPLIQCLTVGPSPAAALGRAWLLFNALTDADGYPLRNLTPKAGGAWRLLRIDALQVPTPIGPRPDGSFDVSFNWQVRAHRTA